MASVSSAGVKCLSVSVTVIPSCFTVVVDASSWAWFVVAGSANAIIEVVKRSLLVRFE